MLKLVLTFYCACFLCTGKHTVQKGYGLTKSGKPAIAGITAACDKKRLGQMVAIGSTLLYCQDTGGKKIRGNRIDVYVASHDEAKRLGVKVVQGSFLGR